MTLGKGVRRRTGIPRPPKAAPARDLHDLERWYLARLVEFVAQRAAQGVKDPPSVMTFAAYARKGHMSVYQMFSKLEALGYLARDERRRFVLRPGATKAIA